MANPAFLMKRRPYESENWVLLVFVLNLLFDVPDCRNIRGHSRYGRPRADPHIVNNVQDPSSAELREKDMHQQRGRRCQVTNVEEKETFFEKEE